MARSIKVSRLIDIVNTFNRHSIGDIGKQQREGHNLMLETVLHECNVYAGFGYLEADGVPAGELPGIRRDAGGKGEHAFPDASRVFYYKHRNLGV